MVKLSGAPLPRTGRMLDEKRAIITPSHAVLNEVSFRGDTDGWREALQRFCKIKGLRWGTIDSGCVILSSGVSYPLDDCSVKTLS